MVTPKYNFIKKEDPSLTSGDFIPLEQLNIYRLKLLAYIILGETAEVNERDIEVWIKMQDNQAFQKILSLI